MEEFTEKDKGRWDAVNGRPPAYEHDAPFGPAALYWRGYREGLHTLLVEAEEIPLDELEAAAEIMAERREEYPGADHDERSSYTVE